MWNSGNKQFDVNILKPSPVTQPTGGEQEERKQEVQNQTHASTGEESEQLQA